MKPGLEELFENETAKLADRNVPRSVRLQQWLRLIHLQEGVVKVQSDGSIATPINPEDAKDVKEYLARLKQFKVPQ
jgi:hypothetical protein